MVSGMTDLPNVAFHDLPASAFPIDIYAYPEHSLADEFPLWTRHITGPGAISIPGVAEKGQRVRLVVKYGDGTEYRA